MPLRSALLFVMACCLVGLVGPGIMGFTYTDRLAARPSLHLVSVADGERLPEIRRPRRAALVVLDGLGHEDAAQMRSLERIRERGQCRKTDVGSLPLSRPVYGVLSTGVEQDRGGALINESTSPHDARSIWEIARDAGLRVAAVSEVDYWQHLFPRGFDAYSMPPRDADYFRAAAPADLLLVHPVYIDETGHEHGADSDAYRAAVSRADRELAGFMGTLDLERDLLVVTSDHGHSLRGGHGGRQDRVARVLTCLAGPGVQHRSETGVMRATSIAPALALLMGLRFPPSMRAGDDDLDVLWEIADPSALPAVYLAERRGAVERFRAENRAELARRMPESGGSWAAFYRAARWRQAWRALPIVLPFLLLLWVHGRGHRHLPRYARGSRFELLFGVAALIACAAIAISIQITLRGSFDMSSIDSSAGFIGFTLLLGAVVGIGTAVLHLLLRRCLHALFWDLGILSIAGTLLSLAHPLAFGWHLDFPIPAPPLFFFPLFATLFLIGFNLVALLLALVVLASPRWPALERRLVPKL